MAASPRFARGSRASKYQHGLRGRAEGPLVTARAASSVRSRSIQFAPRRQTNCLTPRAYPAQRRTRFHHAGADRSARDGRNVVGAGDGDDQRLRVARVAVRNLHGVGDGQRLAGPQEVERSARNPIGPVESDRRSAIAIVVQRRERHIVQVGQKIGQSAGDVSLATAVGQRGRRHRGRQRVAAVLVRDREAACGVERLQSIDFIEVIGRIDAPPQGRRCCRSPQ